MKQPPEEIIAAFNDAFESIMWGLAHLRRYPGWPGKGLYSVEPGGGGPPDKKRKRMCPYCKQELDKLDKGHLANCPYEKAHKSAAGCVEMIRLLRQN